MPDWVADQRIERAIRNSRWLSQRPQEARWLFRLAIDAAEQDAPSADGGERLAERLRSAVREKYMSPVLVWFLVNLVVPIVLKLVLKWLEGKDADYVEPS